MAIYKTVIVVTVLSDSPNAGSRDLEDIVSNMRDGDMLGTTHIETLNALVQPDHELTEIEAVGGDSTFFGQLED